jgi:hypothetical protein
VNHEPINSDNEGMHSVLTLRNQNNVNPATSANEVAIYNNIVSSIPELIYRPNNSQTPIQLTFPSIDTTTVNRKYTCGAGPFVIYGGLIPAATNGQVVNLSPVTTLQYVGLVMANIKAPNILVSYVAAATNVAGNSFTISFNAAVTGPRDIYYFAIGV